MSKSGWLHSRELWSLHDTNSCWWVCSHKGTKNTKYPNAEEEDNWGKV